MTAARYRTDPLNAVYGTNPIATNEEPGMTAITVETLEATLPKLAKVSTVFHAYHEDADGGDIDELYTDLELAKQHTAAVYAYEEYGHALIPAGALAWEPLANGWKLVDQGSDTGIVVGERDVFGVEAGAR